MSNPPVVPNPALDYDPSHAGTIAIQGGSSSIAPGDWVGLDPSAMVPDPLTVSLFQVCNVYPEANEIGILALRAGRYYETILSGAWVRNVFRHQVKV